MSRPETNSQTSSPTSSGSATPDSNPFATALGALYSPDVAERAAKRAARTRGVTTRITQPEVAGHRGASSDEDDSDVTLEERMPETPEPEAVEPDIDESDIVLDGAITNDMLGLLDELGIGGASEQSKALADVEAYFTQRELDVKVVGLRWKTLTVEASAVSAHLLRYDKDQLLAVLEKAHPGVVTTIRIRSRG